ncbi:hypothetical protein HDV00_001408 [Rhizophlyctis rosea]|nr:hypothetical protein HDV00_001408 [Rhizophlyctis rosea]
MKDQDPKQKRPEIIEYLNAENAYAKVNYLEPNKELTDKIYNEFLSRIQEDDEEVPVFKSPFYYYKRTVKGKNYPIYARKRDSMDASEEVLLDQNTFTHEYQHLYSCEASPDHKILAYALDTNGDEHYQLHFKDLESGKNRDSDTINDCSGSMEWCNDSRTVYYTVLDHIHRSHKVFRHKLGTAQADDALIFHEEDAKFEVHIDKTNSDKFILVDAESSLTREVYTLDADNPNAELRLFQKREHRHKYSVEHQEDKFLVLTDGGGKFLNYKLCACPLDKTEQSNWVDVIPYDPYKELISIQPFQKHVVLYERSEGLERMRVWSSDPKEGGYLDFPEELYSVGDTGGSTQNYYSPVTRFVYESLITPRCTLEYNMDTKERKLLKQKKVPGGYDASQYTMRRVFVPVPQETSAKAPFDTPVTDRIPVSILYKTDVFKGDGTNPCCLYGYGSYGISLDPLFDQKLFSYVDRGFVYAVAHIRGGGECGKAWYETGKFKHKRNTFTDFIAAGDYLVEQKFTTHELMAMEGRSAGGLLMGAVLNMRPDLTHVAIASVPFVDVINTMMDPSIPLTVNEYEEWGNPNEKDYFDYMLSYSPYDNLKAGIKFPHLLVKAGLNDPRVQYWEPAKWVAKMRDLKLHGDEDDPDRRKLIFDCNMGWGHFGASGRYGLLKENAEEFAFVINRIEKQLIKLGVESISRAESQPTHYANLDSRSPKPKRGPKPLDLSAYTDLAGASVGGRVLFATDDFFQVAENMLLPTEPVWDANAFTEFGKWMDGWETRRKRTLGHDWCILKLGLPGRLIGFEIDTAYFTGNQTPFVSVQAANLTDEEVPLVRRSEMGSSATVEELAAAEKIGSDKWVEVLPVTQLKPGYEATRRHMLPARESGKAWTHLRLLKFKFRTPCRINMFPDGGIARLRALGIVARDWGKEDPNRVLNLAAVENGGRALGASDSHFGKASNLIAMGRAKNMGEGWETARNPNRPKVYVLGPDGNVVMPGHHWVVLKLCHAGVVDEIEVDTDHFCGNFPESCVIEGTYAPNVDSLATLNDAKWFTVLPRVKLGPNCKARFSKERGELDKIDGGKTVTHLRLVIYPDGGVSRLRVFGKIVR